MKPKLLISVILMTAVTAFIFNRPSTEINITASSPQPTGGDNFLIGCINSSTLINDYYNELGINFTHAYASTEEPGPLPKDPNRHTPGCRWWGTQQSDWEYLYDSVPVAKIHSKLNEVTSAEKSGKLLWERPKIKWLAYGQSSTYQAEWLSLNHDYWFYSFNFSSGQTVRDFDFNNGDSVLYCGIPTDGANARYILKGLRANTEQCRKDYGSDINQWEGDDECTWYVKPRIRIDSIFANNPVNFNTLVCRLDVKNQDGNTFKSVDLRVRNFLVDTLGTYSGRYIEEFTYLLGDSVLTYEGAWGDSWYYAARGDRTFESHWHKADIQVYWYDYCPMWLDYVKVENDVADKLLKGYYDDPNFPDRMWIKNEVKAITESNTPDAVYAFYVELAEFNNIPCIAYLNERIKYWSSNTIGFTYDLLCYYQYHLPYEKRGEIVTIDKIKGMWFNKVQPKQIFLGDPYTLNCMPADGCVDSPQFSQIPITLSSPPNPYVLAIETSPATYDAWLQGMLDTVCGLYVAGGYEQQGPMIPGVFMYLMKQGNAISKECDIPFIAMLQIHQWSSIRSNGLPGEMDREPTTEELNLLTNLAIAYGAKGIIYWEYISGEDNTLCNHNLGLISLEPNSYLEPREENVYGQPKWEDTKDIFARIHNKWGPTLMSFNNTQTNSYIYRLERNTCLSESYFHDIVTYKKSGTQEPCYEDNPLPGQNPPQGLVYECYEDRYLQVATFKESSTERRTYPYFMLVNRRCSPYIDELSEDNRGGKRNVRVIFDGGHSELTGYNNWEIINVVDGSVAGSFNKTVLTLVDLDDFMPGEGKLYHLLPTAKVGGELLADEYITSGEEFTCEDTVWTNGYNLMIENGVTIHFSDSAKFVVNGGTFQIGDDEYSGPNNITMDAPQGGSWKGFEFNGATVKIYGVNFSGLANDSIAMLSMIDCPLIDLRNNSFSLQTGNNKSAIDIAYVNQMVYISNAYIGSNTFTGSETQLPFVKVMAYSGFTTPIIVESNSFTGTSTALFLNNIQGGAVKSNSFSGFGRAVTALTSSLDVFENTITSTGAHGLEALSGTELKMSYAGGLLIGGKNNITNSDSSSYNIYLENSYFLMNDGENIFDVGYGGYHLYGWFPDSYGGEYGASENCFKVASSVVDPPLHYVTLGEQGNQITDFEFTPYLTGCTQEGGEGMLVINLGDGIYDTVGILGQGGSYSSNYVITPKTIYDSISISMRFRNYANVKSLCLQLLNNYPDSMQSLGALSKLYLAVSKTDTTTQGIADLKTLYENLILNHSNNISLVKRCNYYVQKCKVLLHQYSSALTGFQQIINNNPASYEGLVARWDYMATSLLMQGQGGSEKGVIPLWGGVDVPMDIGTDGVGQDDDRSPFTKEERKQIKQAVTTALEVSKYTEEKREKILTELSTRGDVNATRQLKVLKSLGQTVKVEKPKNISEHLKIVSGDIQKVFVNPNAGKNTNATYIPQEYRLSQNYPNPFNPTTKISYDIPKNSIVKLTIYDILGREVIKLVNNELKQPGRYVVEFNGTNLASGVYFYRIETGNFVQAKKMVLVK